MAVFTGILMIGILMAGSIVVIMGATIILVKDRDACHIREGNLAN